MILRMSNQTERKSSPPCAIASIAEARFRANSHKALWGISCKAEQGVRLGLEEDPIAPNPPVIVP
jgi:hypothetical protein